MSLINGLYQFSADILPSQIVPLKEKLKDSKDPDKKSWKQKNLDALESIGRSQYHLNLPLIENYEMIKGRFIFSHYFETEGYKSLLSQLSAEVELPNYLRHYDIISQVVNTMSGEWQKRPDGFKVKQVGDGATNEYLRTKEELLSNYIFGNINREIDRKLVERGIDPQKQDFASEEEAQQYYQELDVLRQEMTPIEIQKYMDTDFLTRAEIWGNDHKEKSREYFNLSEKEKVEFEDMLVSDRAFRHFFLAPSSEGYMQETWNPINVFFHKSPDITYIEDGDYVGRIFHLSINTIIDRYGHLMSNEDFELLKSKYYKGDKRWEDHKYSWVYDNYLVPFNGYPEYQAIKQISPNFVPPSGELVPSVDSSFFKDLNSNSFYRDHEGFYFVTEAYWKSQKKLLKITYLDEMGDLIVKIVDEQYEIPKYFKESKKIFTEDHDLDTYCITYVNEVWKGIKINAQGDRDLNRDIYIDIRPNDFQFKGNYNLYGCKLPVCGQVFSIRNSGSMSLVDLMKPYQIAYNVSMNQVYNLMEKEVGMFVIMDVNMFPNSKDWGGADSWEKWMMIAKNLGMVPIDTKPDNLRQSLAATGGQFPKIINMDLGAQMVSRINLCQFFEEQALKQVGFNQFRTGNYSTSTTATGIQQGVSTSYAQTESYFTNFSNYLRRCIQMDLDMAQYVQSQKETIDILYTKGDTSKAFIKILGTDLLLSDLGIFVSNSQEHLRQLEMIRQFALENNTAGLDPVSVADIIMMNSPKEIRKSMEKGFKAVQEQQQQQQQLQQQAIEQDAANKQADREEKARQFNEELQNNIDVAYINAGVKVITSDPSDPQSPNNNAGQLEAQIQNNQANANLKQQQIDNEKNKTDIMAEIERLKLLLKQSEIEANIAIQNKETETAKILKNKDSKSK